MTFFSIFEEGDVMKLLFGIGLVVLIIGAIFQVESKANKYQ